MYKVYGDMLSGNCYKIKLIMNFLEIEHEWIHIDILTSETHMDSFRMMNPNARIPVLKINEGKYLWESNAILNYLAQDTIYLPTDRYEKSIALQWQFFEQYSHEPYIATARYIKKYLGLPKNREGEYLSKQEGGHKALSLMEEQLKKSKFFLGDKPTIADICLYAYTHVAEEGGFSLAEYRNIQRWFSDFVLIPGYVKMDRENV
ncbi:MAG: glutathione S-transferase family protein [Xanthomonadales bacterium]|nr:glutathione S-transferase family protein [Xanthomonadales bacterium]